MKRKRRNEDYIRIFHLYVNRKIFMLLLLLILSTLIFLFHKDLQQLWNRITNQNMEATTFSYHDLNLASYQGNVKILNKEGRLTYEGMFSKGACNGKGTLYDEHGHKIYTGEFIDNVMEDKSGTLYFDKGEMRKYIGEVHNNRADGDGRAYRKTDDTYKLLYEGSFVDGEFEGRGIYYDKNGNIDYEGEFLDNMRHGQGILYEEGAYTRKVYQGEFAFGRPQGTGTLFNTFGKAYYTGAMHEGHINFTSFLPSTLEDIQNSFLLPYQIYVYENTTAIVYKTDLLSLAFFTKYPLKLEKSEKEWKLKDKQEAKDIVISSVMMVDNNIDDPNTGTDPDKIEASWQKKYRPHTVTGLMDAYDVIALRLTENKAFREYRKCTSLVDHKNNIQELQYHLQLDLTKRVLYPVTELSIGYGYPIYEDKLLYTIMLEEDAAAKEESEKFVK
ncbi:MORN motif containing protein [[Clostridium] innocuum]|uniref:MORN motif containing protein n=1 Tax=Clostridium innocuum TaxID=1522 RepID=UPI00325A41DA